MIGKTKKFLFASLIGLVILCIIIFSWTASTMGDKSKNTINEIGTLYMSEMSKQLREKFEALINLRLSQIEGIVRRTPPEKTSYGDEMLEELALGASVRQLSYLALYTEDGEAEVIYGEPVEAPNMNELLETIADNDIKVTSALTQDGEKLLLLSAHANYEMKDGKTSAALIGGIPMEYINDAMVLDDEGALMHSHIVHKDGSYVIRNGKAFRDNYFERIRAIVDKNNEKEPEEYVQELQSALDGNEDYSTLILDGDSYRHLYCSGLPNSDWYLISVMPYGTLDNALNNLGNQRMYTMLKACGIILLGVLIVFFQYYRMSQRQMEELDKARAVADQANKAKSEFLSNMSHDIRTPMNGILGMTTIAMTNVNDPAKVQDCLKKITMSGKHLLGLINDVLDMSKIENGKMTLNMEQLSLREIMDSIVNIIQPQVKAKGQHFDIFIQKIVTENVICDGVRLNQILINLLSNAVKFTPEGGAINVYLTQEPSPQGETYIRCHFRVKDSGIGMSQEFQQKIFETFTREKTSQVHKTEGTGLGMAITKCIVDAMHGSIEVHSEPGQGSEFHITVDMEKAEEMIEDMVLPPWKMLVVDNNEDLCRSAVNALGEIGVTAEWALDGQSAIQMVEKHHNTPEAYQIILLDWKMPDMDGLHTTREIRKRVGKDLPILIVSAYDWSDIEEDALKAGADGFIPKPLFKSNLYLGLRHFTGETVTATEQKEEPPEEKFKGKRILLSEDNDLNWEIAEDILSDAGFELERAENGQICVDKFSQAEAGSYDVILMDIRMPVMNGYEAAQAIRALDHPDANLPIIAMTADAFSEDIQRCLDCGMNAHISKPIDVNKLMIQLEKYLK
ncbi:MAG: response regulator [Lachnospiraceae bacterium]|nr:response regulator [Lachnospiraceae bacterium]